MKEKILIPAIIVLLVVQSVTIIVLVDNQSKLDDLLLSAAEYRSRLLSLHTADTTYFRLFYLNVAGKSMQLPVTISGSDYMNLRDKVRQNFTTRYDLIDYKQFITPSDRVITDIRDRIRSTFPSDLDYAEAVLDLVHQIYYYSPSSGNWYMKYPVETLAEGSGLCAHLSVLATSLLKSANIDAVLIIYLNPEAGQPGHMNVGIHLDSDPFPGAQFVERAGQKYYIAETTNSMFTASNGFSWDNSWRVGQMPSFLYGWGMMTIEV